MRVSTVFLFILGCFSVLSSVSCNKKDTPVIAASRPVGLATGVNLDLVARLEVSEATNLEQILEDLKLLPTGDFDFRSASFRKFALSNPYEPSYHSSNGSGEARRDVIEWYEGYPGDQSVCGVKFISKTQYRLKTFANRASATDSGYVVTHYKSCGACSSLKDLAVFIATPDLTSPARRCAKKLSASRAKECFEKEIGFTPYCAEIWAYNAAHTKDRCLGTCIREYGLFNLLMGNFEGDSNNNAQGQLNPCIQCDETHSGAGFKYGSGRTRRNSGIISAIERPEDQIIWVDHTRYFEHL